MKHSEDQAEASHHSTSSLPNAPEYKADDWRSTRLLQLIVFFCHSAFVMELYLSYQYTYHRILHEALTPGKSPPLDNASMSKVAGNGKPTIHHFRSYCSLNSTSPIQSVTEKAQRATAILQLYLSLAQGLPAICSVLILGSRSDIAGRKIVLAVGNLGLVLFSGGYLLVTSLELHLSYLVLVHILCGISGHLPIVYMASFAYTSDVTEKDNVRSWQMIRLQATTGFAAGSVVLLVGVMIQKLGFVWPNVLAFALALLSLFCCFFLQENKDVFQNKGYSFNILENCKRLLTVYTENKDDNHRKSYFVCSVIMLLCTATLLGTLGVEALFQLNSPLCWNALQIGFFGALRDISRSTIGAALIWVLLKWFSDTTVAMVVSAIYMAALITEGCARSSAVMYTVAVLSMTGIYLIGLTKAIASKITPRSHYGAVFAGLASIQAFAQMIGPVIFNAIYQSLLDTLPGAVFFIVASVVVVILLLYALVNILLKRHNSAPEKAPILAEKPQGNSER